MYLYETTPLTPLAARYDQATLDRLAAYYARLVEAKRIQGASFLLARDGQVFAHQSCGRLSNAPGRERDPLKPDSIKRVASITKVFTATAVMQLVDQGALWLDQPVAKIIPEFDTPMHKSITVFHLLTHTSGLPADGGYFCEPYPFERFHQMQEADWLTKAVLGGPLQSPPGEAWSYSTIGFSVLAEIVSRCSGMHFNDWVEQKIFQPLGMRRSFLEVPAALHAEVSMNSEWEPRALLETGKREGCPNGGGGVYSSLGDLNRFAQCVLNQGSLDGARILSKKSVQAMTRNQLDGVPSFHWGLKLKNYRHGLGWSFFADGNTTGPETFNHEGWGWSSLFIDPVERFVFAAFLADSEAWDPDLMVKPRTIAFAGLL